jgi:hypothetical protein
MTRAEVSVENDERDDSAKYLARSRLSPSCACLASLDRRPDSSDVRAPSLRRQAFSSANPRDQGAADNLPSITVRSQPAIQSLRLHGRWCCEWPDRGQSCEPQSSTGDRIVHVIIASWLCQASVLRISAKQFYIASVDLDVNLFTLDRGRPPRSEVLRLRRLEHQADELSGGLTIDFVSRTRW